MRVHRYVRAFLLLALVMIIGACDKSGVGSPTEPTPTGPPAMVTLPAGSVTYQREGAVTWPGGTPANIRLVWTERGAQNSRECINSKEVRDAVLWDEDTQTATCNMVFANLPGGVDIAIKTGDSGKYDGVPGSASALVGRIHFIRGREVTTVKNDGDLGTPQGHFLLDGAGNLVP